MTNCIGDINRPQTRPYADIMMTSSNGNIFRVTGPLCGEFTGPGEFPAQRPVTRSFDIFFDLLLNKRLRNNREAGDLRCHRGHYAVNVMSRFVTRKQPTGSCLLRSVMVILPAPIGLMWLIYPYPTGMLHWKGGSSNHTYYERCSSFVMIYCCNMCVLNSKQAHGTNLYYLIGKTPTLSFASHLGFIQNIPKSYLGMSSIPLRKLVVVLVSNSIRNYILIIWQR